MTGEKREIWSFFSGAMGLDLGFELGGLAPTMAVEIDKDCCNTIRTNRPELTLVDRSVSELDADSLRRIRDHSGDVFLMIGGPPCQSFSSGGNRAALSDPRGNLIYEYMRLIGEVRPRFFLFENVANLVTAALRHRKIEDRPGKRWSLKSYNGGKFDHLTDAKPLDADELSGTAIRQILSDFKLLGYKVVFGVLNSADYGAPQHRLRFVMIGSRDGESVSLPDPMYGNSRPGIPQYRTVRHAIWDLMDDPGPHSQYSEQFAAYFRHIPEGGNWRHLPEHLKREAMGASYEAGGGKTGFFRRLSWDAPSPTITGKANRKASAICHPSETRPLSVKECARIQGFPDDWRITGSMAAQYQQIGNAVPVNLGSACSRIFAKASENDGGNAASWAFDVDLMLENAVQRLRASARNKKSERSKILPLVEDDAA